jgi:hypothetical protein
MLDGNRELCCCYHTTKVIVITVKAGLGAGVNEAVFSHYSTSYPSRFGGSFSWYVFIDLRPGNGL